MKNKKRKFKIFGWLVLAAAAVLVYHHGQDTVIERIGTDFLVYHPLDWLVKGVNGVLILLFVLFVVIRKWKRNGNDWHVGMIAVALVLVWHFIFVPIQQVGNGNTFVAYDSGGITAASYYGTVLVMQVALAIILSPYYVPTVVFAGPWACVFGPRSGELRIFFYPILAVGLYYGTKAYVWALEGLMDSPLLESLTDSFN